jgi:hypothetical protein
VSGRGEKLSVEALSLLVLVSIYETREHIEGNACGLGACAVIGNCNIHALHNRVRGWRLLV